jgi:hypothetical protein
MKIAVLAAGVRHLSAGTGASSFAPSIVRELHRLFPGRPGV